MKSLTLVKKVINHPNGKFLYQIYEDETVLCFRRSSRHYVAAMVEEILPPIPAAGEKWEKPLYACNYFFGRIERVGKGESGKVKNPYGLAVLQGESETVGQNTLS